MLISHLLQLLFEALADMFIALISNALQAIAQLVKKTATGESLFLTGLAMLTSIALALLVNLHFLWLAVIITLTLTTSAYSECCIHKTLDKKSIL